VLEDRTLGRDAWKRRLFALAPLACAVGWLSHDAVSTILAKVGHPAAALDDAYIHFQYARAIAEGHPFRFQTDAPRTSGATSILWPVALAPFYAVGFRGNGILWGAWALSFVALGGLAWEVSSLTSRIAGRTAALGAGCMTLAFAGFTWCAASGMEVVPFAWMIARAMRRAAEWAEGSAPLAAAGNSSQASATETRTTDRAGELVAMAWMAVFLRPEGAVTALFVAATLAVFVGPDQRGTRLWALAAAGAVAGPALLLWMLTGSPRSTTATAKLLPGNPYFVGSVLQSAVLEHARILLHTLLNGEVWSAEFLPHGGGLVAIAGLGAVAVLGVRARSRWRACGVLLLALSIFAPCFYYTFLWNRLRYVWPFASGWIVGLACLARLVGDAAILLHPRGRMVTGVLCGVFAGLFASKLEGTVEDVAQSASGIDRQQVALGLWAKESLPPSAVIGLNDTGAIAYFGDRRTFDIVGLTTAGEARYWVAGAGSRLEHYERLRASAPEALPTHFIVYPEWMAMDGVLGKPLYEATVNDATILGGRTMRAYEADWSKLGTGETPWSTTELVVDDLDVADLESEAEHDYQILDARDGDETAHEGPTPDGHTVLDGGRTQRSFDRFVAHLPSDQSMTGVVRLQGPPGASIRVRVIVGGEALAAFALPSDEDWVEQSFDIPARLSGPRVPIEVRFSGGLATVFHYWFVKGT
jgi:hypothetical protein